MATVTIEELLLEIQELKAENAALKAELCRLKNTDSTNSSQPSSKDLTNKLKNQSLRERSGKKPGAQMGHKGQTREQVASPDKVINCEPDKCTKCGTDLATTEGKVVSVKQEVDVVTPKAEVTEYRQIRKVCPKCKRKNHGNMPEHLISAVQIGNNTKSLATYLHIAHKVPFLRTVEIISDLLGLQIAEGTLENALDKALNQAKKIHPTIMDKLKQSEYINSDETGLRVDKKRWQLWTWCNSLYSYYAASPSRGYKVIAEHLGEDYTGTSVHDCFSAQNNTKATKHQHCLAHYDRSLKYCIEYESCDWSQAMHYFLLSARKIRDSIWHENFEPNSREKIIAAFHEALAKLMKIPPAQKEGMKLYKRFLKHSDKILTFLESPTLPADNNGAERAIRNAKIHQKVSGCFRSSHGAIRYAVILSAIETAKKQGLHALEACQKLFLGNLAFA